jgi:hypothetical protein
MIRTIAAPCVLLLLCSGGGIPAVTSRHNSMNGMVTAPPIASAHLAITAARKQFKTNTSGTCTVGGNDYVSISGCESALPSSGGVIHAEGAALSISAVQTINKPTVLYLPCGVINVSVPDAITVTANDVTLRGCGQGANDAENPSIGLTTFSLTTAGPAILVRVPAASRINANAASIFNFRASDLQINMNGNAGRAIYETSCDSCTIDHVQVLNADPGSGGACLYVEADLASPNNLAVSYSGFINDFNCSIISANRTGWPVIFDGIDGEIGYWFVNNARTTGAENSAGSGAGGVLLETSASSVPTSSVNHMTFTNLHVQDTAPGTYAIRLEAPGNYVARTAGVISNIFFDNLQAERLNHESRSGTGIGCTSHGAGNGTGCGAITLLDPVLSNWTTYIDHANMGAQFLDLGDVSNPTFPTMRFSAPIYGANDYQAYFNAVLTPVANSQILGEVSLVPQVNKGIYTGTTALGINLDCASGSVTGTGTIGTYSCLNIDGDPVAGSHNYAVDLNGGTLYNAKIVAPVNSMGLQVLNTGITCTTSATQFSACITAPIYLPVTYPDTNYRLGCTGLAPRNLPMIETVTKSNASFTITLVTLTDAAATYGSFDCWATHN